MFFKPAIKSIVRSKLSYLSELQ